MKKKHVYWGCAGLALLVVIIVASLGSKQQSQTVSPESIVQNIIADQVKKTKSTPLPESEKPAAAEDVWSRNKWMGDYPAMVKRRMIRVLVPPSKTFFFLDKGRKRGLTIDNLMAFEKYINEQLKSKHMQVKVVVIPTSRKHLLRDLESGYGDIAAGNLTITHARKEHVDFTNPLLTGVSEIIVSNSNDPQFKNVFELSGKEVYVRPSSSYYESLLKLNETLLGLGKKPVSLVTVDEYLEDEDLLEMLDVGLIPMIVIDSHKGKFWDTIFPNIRLQPRIKLRVNGQIGMAVRKDTPQLLKVLNDFVQKNKKGTLTGNMLYRRYLEENEYVKNNLSDAAKNKYQQTVQLFKQYAGRYDFPYLMLVALAFQESGLDHKKRSRAGAVGIMQVLPSTAADKNVGIQNINQLENNIHAGTKYLNFMKKRYFSDGSLDELNSDLFTMAAYNAGPARVARLRKQAAKQGFDPNVWFNNVEAIAAMQIGRETVQYVGNIYKYYVVYKHIVKQEQVKTIGKELLQEHYRGL